MKLVSTFKSFKNDESGAVTVDWVVLTAAVVALGFAVMNPIREGLGDLAEKISAEVANVSVNTNQ